PTRLPPWRQHRKRHDRLPSHPLVRVARTHPKDVLAGGQVGELPRRIGGPRPPLRFVALEPALEPQVVTAAVGCRSEAHREIGFAVGPHESLLTGPRIVAALDSA